MRLKIKRLPTAVGLPEPATGAAGFDLAAAVTSRFRRGASVWLGRAW
jgi:hypothetical protein